MKKMTAIDVALTLLHWQTGWNAIEELANIAAFLKEEWREGITSLLVGEKRLRCLPVKESEYRGLIEAHIEELGVKKFKYELLKGVRLLCEREVKWYTTGPGKDWLSGEFSLCHKEKFQFFKDLKEALTLDYQVNHTSSGIRGSFYWTSQYHKGGYCESTPESGGITSYKKFVGTLEECLEYILQK